MALMHVRNSVRALVFFACASATTVVAQQPPPIAAPQPRDYSKEAVVVERTRSVYRFENDGTGRRETYLRVKIQSEAGVQAFGQLVFGYNAASERMDLEFVRVHKADGAVVTAGADAIQDLSSPVERVAPVYTDFRQKHITVPSLRPGETVEVSAITTVHTPLAAGQFWAEYDFRTRGIVLDEQLEIDVPQSRTVRLKTRPGFEPAVAEKDGRKTYRWTSSHLTSEEEDQEKDKAEKDEEKAEEPEPPAVRMTTFQSWEEVGRWYAALEKASRAPTPDVRKKALELTSGRTSELAKLEALYDFVGPNFRYVSLSLGVGRYQPRPAGDVLRDQYGDCKDKHTLLASLMESVGLRASTVLINSRAKIDADFPSPSQFDHAITRAVADKQDVWLDVTTEIAPFRLLSVNLRKKQALVIPSGSAAHLEETPADPPMVNSQVVEVSGKLAELGRLSGRVRLAVRGDVELFMRTIFRRTPAAQWKMVVEGINTSAGIGGDVSDWKVSDPADTHSAFAVEYQVSKATLADWTKKKVDLKLPFSDVSLPDAADTAGEAKSPIELGSPIVQEYKLQLELSSDYKGRAPLPVSIARDYGQYRATYSLANNVFTAERRLQLQGKDVPADRAGDYRAFRRVVMSDADQVLGLDVAAAATAGPPADLKADELFRSGYDALRNGNFPQAVMLLKRVVELEPKHKSAWNNLGLAYFNQNQHLEAIAAFKKQIEVNAYDEYAHNNLGRVYLRQRSYTEAEAAFRKQLEINPLDKFAHGNLGRLYIESKRYPEAITELEQAISLTPDASALHVDMGTALLNADKNDPAIASFDRAASLDSNPTTWNNIAYQLSLKGSNLDRAQQYAESAVSAMTAASRNFTVDNVSARELAVVGSLASYWDTLGWVFFAKGDLTRAEKLVTASWLLGESAEVGDHLAQIYEKHGRRDDAVRTYALALTADRPMQATRERLTRLVGDGAKADEAVRRQATGLERQRTIALDPAGGSVAGRADFVMLFGSGSAVERVAFVGGDEALRGLTGALLKAQFGSLFPDDSPAKLLRRGTVTCVAAQGGAKAPACSLSLVSLSDTRPVQ
jgi:tetratricopeptide (TPR) repeat protein/transglutaminase-like putative cysteine protease